MAIEQIKKAVSAINDDDIDALESLVDQFPELVESVFMGRKTLVNFAAGKNKIDVVKALVDKGADIDPSSNEFNSPLYNACVKSSHEVILWLVENGANPSGYSRSLPVAGAIGSGNIETVRLIVKLGADLSRTFGEFNYTPLTYAESRGDSHAEIADFLREAASEQS